MEPALGVAIALAWLFVVAGGAMIYALVRRHGVALIALDETGRRVAALEHGGSPELPQEPPTEPPVTWTVGAAGLDPGTDAPDFELPDIDGHVRSLEDFRGDPFLLLFFSLTCEYCLQMAPRLGALRDDAPRLVVLSRGDADDHRRLAAEHRWRAEILLERQLDVSALYQSIGTPGAYVIDADGRIGSPLALGADAIFLLVEESVDAPTAAKEPD